MGALDANILLLKTGFDEATHNMLKRTFTTLALLLAVAVPAAAERAVVLVRHAERADTASGGGPAMGADPDLSKAGRTRAASLANVLKDANITEIYATEFKRTQQTAAPTAKALGLTIKTVPSKNTADLVKQIESAKGNVLVVGHSNTVPDVIKGLGVSSPPTIGEADFDNLFVVTLGASPTLVRLHYR
jgi:phosphohistidine phosphatase SixA